MAVKSTAVDTVALIHPPGSPALSNPPAFPETRSLLTIVIATLNERQTLPVLVAEIFEQFPDCHILIVDDNSPDGTGEWVRQERLSNPRLELLHREESRGLGSATLAGIRKALESGAVWIGTMDADLSHQVVDLSRMWSVAEQAAESDAVVIIGSRYVSGGRIENWPRSRRILSRMVNGFARICLRLPTHDNTSALRLYQHTALKRIDLDAIDVRGYAYLEQILMHLRHTASFVEVPIVFTDRSAGTSKATWSVSLRAMADMVRMAIRRK